VKAPYHEVLTAPVSRLEAGDALPIMLPFLVLPWLIAPKPKSFPRPPETLGEYDAFLLKCEIEDLQDEIQRRVDKRKRKRGDVTAIPDFIRRCPSDFQAGVVAGPFVALLRPVRHRAKSR
jgi:hypothetical protein